MISEMDSIKQNHTWELIELLAGRKLLPCKWVYRYKYVSGLGQPKYKSQLFAKGVKKEQGVDYDDIFSLEEDIYMSQPEGFTATREEGHLVC